MGARAVQYVTVYSVPCWNNASLTLSRFSPHSLPERLFAKGLKHVVWEIIHNLCVNAVLECISRRITLSFYTRKLICSLSVFFAPSI